MELAIGLAIALALLALAVFLLSNNQGLPRGTFPTGRKAPVGAKFYSENWTTAPASVAQGAQGTFVLTVTAITNQGTALPVGGHGYIAVLAPNANVAFVSINGKAVTGNQATVQTTKTGTITFVVRTIKAGEAKAAILVGRDQQQIRQKRIAKEFAIPGAP